MWLPCFLLVCAISSVECTTSSLRLQITRAGLQFLSDTAHHIVENEIPKIKLPDFTSNFKSGNMKGYGMYIHSFETPKISIDPSEDGLTLVTSGGHLRVHGQFYVRKNFWFVRFSHRGRFEVVATDMRFALTTRILTTDGQPQFEITNCQFKIDYFLLETKGSIADWFVRLFRPFISSYIRSQINKQACRQMRKQLDKLNVELSRLPTTLSIGSGFVVRYRLAENPLVTRDFFQLDADLEVTFGNASARPIESLPSSDDHSSMVNLWVSDAIPNRLISSIYSIYSQASFMLTHEKTPDIAPFLRTSCLFGCIGAYFPKLRSQFPEQHVSLHISLPSSPMISFTKQSIFNMAVNMDMYIFPKKLYPSTVARLLLTVDGAVGGGVKNGLLTGNVHDVRFKAIEVFSNIGEFSQGTLDSFSHVFYVVLAELASVIGKNGFFIPSYNGFSIDATFTPHVNALWLSFNLTHQLDVPLPETRPASPTNVTVGAITHTSAKITWQPPLENADLVESYTLFIRKEEDKVPLRQVAYATSPYTESELDADSSYAVSVQSHSRKSTSLPATVLFQTPAYEFCVRGEPLYMAVNRPVICGLEMLSCPVGYSCTPSNKGDEAYCCPEDTNSFEACCRTRGMSADCLSACFYNVSSLPDKCASEINIWATCASGGYDHSHCCDQSGVPKECSSACRQPFKVNPSCATSSSKLSACFAQHHSRLPSAVQRLQVSFLDATAVTVEWKHDEVVEYFEAQLFAFGATVNSTNVTEPTVRFSSLQPAREYAVRVIAFNKAGSSPPSFNLTFTTLSNKDESGNRLRAPRCIRIAWNRGTAVNITWNPVTERKNDEKVQENITYTVYYVDTDIQTQLTTLKTNQTWTMVNQLRKDGLYSVYVTATEENGTSSRSSSVLTFIATEDLLGLPEPTIDIPFFRENYLYTAKDRITVNCSVANPIPDINITLTVGSKSRSNKRGTAFVSSSIDVTPSLDTITCAVTDMDGRQNVALRHILVQFGPIVKMNDEKIRSFDDQSVAVTCSVKGYPPPNVRFEYKGKKVDGEVRVRRKGPNTSLHTLMIRNVTGLEGNYTCVAEGGGQKVSDTAELLVQQSLPPVHPMVVLSCCVEEGVGEECLETCSTGRVRVGSNYSQYAESLLRCASDNRDHSDCCARRGVPTKCMSLCTGGDSLSPDVDCSAHAGTMMSCVVRGHEGMPTKPINVITELVHNGQMRVSWEYPHAKEKYVYYLVHYKKADSDDDYVRVNATRSPVELQVDDSNERYNVGVMAVNELGNSPLVFAGEPRAAPRCFNFLSILFTVAIVAIPAAALGIVAARRRFNLFRDEKALLLKGAPVAVENPGYGSDGNDQVELNPEHTKLQSTELVQSTPKKGTVGSFSSSYPEIV